MWIWIRKSWRRFLGVWRNWWSEHILTIYIFGSIIWRSLMCGPIFSRVGPHRHIRSVIAEKKISKFSIFVFQRRPPSHLATQLSISLIKSDRLNWLYISTSSRKVNLPLLANDIDFFSNSRVIRLPSKSRWNYKIVVHCGAKQVRIYRNYVFHTRYSKNQMRKSWYHCASGLLYARRNGAAFTGGKCSSYNNLQFIWQLFHCSDKKVALHALSVVLPNGVRVGDFEVKAHYRAGDGQMYFGMSNTSDIF